MKKSMLKSLVAYLNGETVTNIDEIKQALEAELTKDAEKAEANRALYDTARDVTLMGLAETTVGVTATELYESIADALPDGFTKGKLTYALSRGIWEGIEKVPGDGRVNLYKLAE